ncbi:MAG TPA: MlaD family protein [Phycisphaerae bacterium]|nr:MlaD family protein [Phycisphaerae bacterium]
MTDRRNVVVGLFVLFGLLLFGGLIVWFEGVAVLIRGGYTVRGHLPSARGIRGGKRVHLDGVEIGDVRTVTNSQPERHGVWVEIRVNPDVRIPQDAILVVQQSTIGDLYLDFQTPIEIEGAVTETGTDPDSGEALIRCTFPDGVLLRPGNAVRMAGKQVGSVQTVGARENEQPGIHVGLRIHTGTAVPADARVAAKKPGVGQARVEFGPPDRPFACLPTNGTARVDGVIKAPELLPEDMMTDFREAMGKFGQLDAILNNVQDFTQPRTLKDVEAGKQSNVWTVLEQVERTAKSLDVQLHKPTGELGGLIADARKAAQTLQKAMEQAGKTLATVDQAGKTIQESGKKVNVLVTKGDAFIAKLSKDSDEAGKLIQNLNALVTDVRGGKGTVGKLVADDELHRALVTLIENLRATTDNINRLVILWREEGVIWGKEGK